MFIIDAKAPVVSAMTQYEILGKSNEYGVRGHLFALARGKVFVLHSYDTAYSEREMEGIVGVLSEVCSDTSDMPRHPKPRDCSVIIGCVRTGTRWGIVFRKKRYRVVGIEHRVPYIDSRYGDSINIVSLPEMYMCISRKTTGTYTNIYLNTAGDIWIDLNSKGKSNVHNLLDSDICMGMSKMWLFKDGVLYYGGTSWRYMGLGCVINEMLKNGYVRCVEIRNEEFNREIQIPV